MLLSAFEGAISGKIIDGKGEAVSTEIGTVSVTLNAISTWTLIADSCVSEFNGDVASVNVNGHTLSVKGVALTA